MNWIDIKFWLKTMVIYKKGVKYPITSIPLPMPVNGICKHCSCPRVLNPIITTLVENSIGYFVITGYKSTDSKGNAHHCLKYKISDG